MNNNFDSSLFKWVLGFGIVFGMFIIIILITLLVIYIMGRWKLYEKAGKEGWKSIVPFYNDWVYVEMAGLKSWYFLLLIAGTISVTIGIDDEINISYGMFRMATLVGLFFCNYNISKKLHKDTLFAVLMTLFPFVVVPIVGFSDKYTWDDSVSVSENGPIDDANNSSSVKGKNNKNENYKYCGHCGAKIEKSSKYCSNCGKEI